MRPKLSLLWSGSETVTEYDVNFTPFVLNSHSIDLPSLTFLVLEVNSEEKKNAQLNRLLVN